MSRASRASRRVTVGYLVPVASKDVHDGVAGQPSQHMRHSQPLGDKGLVCIVPHAGTGEERVVRSIQFYIPQFPDPVQRDGFDVVPDRKEVG